MKTLKLAAFALTLGFFATSCGNSETTEETIVDTTIIEAPVETVPVEPTPVPVDTTVAPVTTDTVPAAH